MRRGALLAVLAIVAVGLSGCAGFTELLKPPDPGVPSVLGNLQHCDRTYRGALGAGVTGSFEISCKAADAPKPAPAEPVT